jgi:glutathione S-transferase
MGERFTVADAYLFTVTKWAKHVSLDLGPWPVIAQYMERVGARPAVQAALEAERLNK